MEMVLSGECYDAEFAARVGLVNRVVPQADLLEEAMTYAERLARRAPLAQQAAKEVLLRAYGQTEDLDEGTTRVRRRSASDGRRNFESGRT